jgi:hypothetical protein
VLKTHQGAISTLKKKNSSFLSPLKLISGGNPANKDLHVGTMTLFRKCVPYYACRQTSYMYLMGI